MLGSGKQQFLCWQLPNVMFLYIILHMAIKFQGTNVNVLLLATIDREKLSYKSVSHIPVCPRLAAKVWLYGHGHTNFCATGPCSHTSKGLAISRHAATS